MSPLTNWITPPANFFSREPITNIKLSADLHEQTTEASPNLLFGQPGSHELDDDHVDEALRQLSSLASGETNKRFNGDGAMLIGTNSDGHDIWASLWRAGGRNLVWCDGVHKAVVLLVRVVDDRSAGGLIQLSCVRKLTDVTGWHGGIRGVTPGDRWADVYDALVREAQFLYD